MRILDLIESVARDEERRREAPFLAPCVPGGRLRVRVGRLVADLAPEPHEFEGWGVFRQESDRRAALVEEAGLPLVERYLALFAPVRLLLALPVRSETWYAVAANASDVRQRGLAVGPVLVHLVDGASRFDRVVARWDGAAFWFEALDTRADPVLADRMRVAFAEGTHAAELRLRGLTPEMRAAFDLSGARVVTLTETRGRRRADPRVVVRRATAADRLRSALERGGGALIGFAERGRYFDVVWTTSAGERQHSTVTARDLTVVSSGICLSGRDRDFDLLSLVGVVEERGW